MNCKVLTALQFFKNGKWQEANGKLMVCDSIYKTSQRAKILLTEQIHKGGVPLFEEGMEHDRRRWRKQGV